MKSFDNSSYILGVLIVLTKTSDMVHHDILFWTLLHYGIRSCVKCYLKLLTEYITAYRRRIYGKKWIQERNIWSMKRVNSCSNNVFNAYKLSLTSIWEAIMYVSDNNLLYLHNEWLWMLNWKFKYLVLCSQIIAEYC